MTTKIELEETITGGNREYTVRVIQWWGESYAGLVTLEEKFKWKWLAQRRYNQIKNRKQPIVNKTILQSDLL